MILNSTNWSDLTTYKCVPKDMSTTRTERSLDTLEKNHKILCEKLDCIQAGLKDVLDANLQY